MELRLVSSALWALSAGILLAIPVTFLATGDLESLPLIGAMLGREHIVERIAPIAILALISWVLVVLAALTWQVRREHLALSMFRSFAEQPDLDEFQPGEHSARAPRALRRANFISECWRRNPASLNEALPAAAGLDASGLASSYNSLHVYAWTLPVIGFIGTAAGLASAIQGFKEALSKTANTAMLVTDLSQLVIPGLAAAFEITMLALAASLVTYVGASALRSWDQQALDELDRLSVAFLSRVPQHRRPEEKAVFAVLRDIAQKLDTAFNVPSTLVGAAEAMSLAVQDFSVVSESTSRSIGSAMSAMSLASEELRRTAALPYQVSITRGTP